MELNEIVDKYLPDAIERLYPEFRPFFTSYMQWLETHGVNSVLSRFDINQARSEFIDNFTNVYLNGIPTASSIKTLSEEEIRHFVKEITEVNKSKGLDAAIKYFFNRIFNSDIEIEHGLLGVLLKYKPVEVSFVASDSDGNQISNPNYHLYSYQPFVVVDNQNLNGFCQTYFNDGDNKLWIDSLNGTLNVGDVLYFPETQIYAKITYVGLLDLDGWFGQKERWVDADGMYITGRYNNRLYNTLPIEINGFSEFTVYPYSANNTTYTTEFTNTGKLTITINDSTYTGNISEQYIIEDSNGVVYTTSVEFVVNAGLIEKLVINGNDEVLAVPATNTTRQFNATEFYDSNKNKAMSEDELSLVMDRVAIHTIYLKTDVPRDIYFKLIRDIVFPAGFSIFTLFSFFSGVLEGNETYSSKDYYKLLYERENLGFLDIATVFESIKTSLQLGERFVSMSLQDWDMHYKYDLWTDRFIGDVDYLDTLLVGIIDTKDYTDVPMFTILYPKLTEIALKYNRLVNTNTYTHIKLSSVGYVNNVIPRLYSVCYWMNNEMYSPYSIGYFKTGLLDTLTLEFIESDECNTTDILYDINYAPPTKVDINESVKHVNTDYTYTDLSVTIN